MEEKYYFEGTRVAYSNVPKIPYNPLKRPVIHYGKFAAALLGFAVLEVLLFFGGWRLFAENGRQELYTALLCAGAAAIYLALIAKRAIIWIVHFYQSKAPDGVRLQCVFEPSCSEYMILAVEKYGALRGVRKGIGRLRRCHGPNCGIDYP